MVVPEALKPTNFYLFTSDMNHEEFKFESNTKSYQRLYTIDL